MNVRAKLERLEKAAGVGVMCLACKRSLILYADTLKRTRREDRHVRPCPECGFPSFTILDGFNERERALILETFYGEQPRTLAGRQRNYAAQVYYFVHPAGRAVQAVAEREEKRLRDLNPPGKAARTQLKVLDEWRARQAEQVAARRLRLSEEEDEAREERKAKSAPTMAAIESARAASTSSPGQRSDEELYFLRVMAGLEPIIFGETLPETLARIEAHERGVREAAERKEREDREREERRERERLEREERYRLEREERERERQERAGEWVPRPVAPVGTPEKEGQSVVVSRFRKDPAAPVSPSALVIDPTCAHVPADSGAFQDKGTGPLPGFIAPSAPEPARMARFPDEYDPNHPDAVQFQRWTFESKPLHPPLSP